MASYNNSSCGREALEREEKKSRGKAERFVWLTNENCSGNVSPPTGFGRGRLGLSDWLDNGKCGRST
jgi:hypothetical protein